MGVIIGDFDLFFFFILCFIEGCFEWIYILQENILKIEILGLNDFVLLNYFYY